MHQVSSRPRSLATSARLAGPIALLACLLLAIAAQPALAKELFQAALDAPIAMDTPPGTTILVGVTVTMPDGDIVRPIEGSPIYLRLFGRDGSSTRAAGVADVPRGHYTMLIEIPAGGARRVEVGIHGTTDLPITLLTDPLAFGGITAHTAQAAPALAPALTPFPRASAAAAVEPAPVVPDPAPAAGAGAPAPGPSPLPWLLAVATGLVLVVGVGLAARRRSRAGARPTAPGRVPGA